jgi:hypothetical protein
MAGEAILSREDALILLDEFREILPRLQEGEVDEELSDQTRRLVESLDRLPLPQDLREDRVKEMSAWADLLLKHRSEDERKGPGQVTTLMESEILDLQRMVKEGREG